jgi:hypothetical protein
MAALRMLEELLLFPLRGINVDNDGAFLNAPLEHWCEKHQPRIELTRSRAYQSNHQAWVEQKNGTACPPGGGLRTTGGPGGRRAAGIATPRARKVVHSV